jgi:putative transposase
VPRAPRIDIPGLVYHVISRGVKRLPIFQGDHDRQAFLRLLSQTRHEFPFRLHAYCLMTNHYHLLLQTLEHSLSKTMQYFKTIYAKRFNREIGHVGHVFQGRFHSIPVQEDAYFITVARYIHLNPVKAGIVARPEDYAWSNYGRLIRGEADPLVEPATLLSYFGQNTDQQRGKYRGFVEEGLAKPEIISDKALWRMRFWGKPPVQITGTPLSQQPR